MNILWLKISTNLFIRFINRIFVKLMYTKIIRKEVNVMYDDDYLMDQASELFEKVTTVEVEPITKETKKAAKKALRLEKRKQSKMRKVLGYCVAGIIMGTFAGLSFSGVNYVSHVVLEKEISVETSSDVFDKNASASEGIVSNILADDTINTTKQASAVITDVTDVVEKVMPSVVSIVNKYTAKASFYGQNYSEAAEASGSGIVIGQNDSELLVVTNYHVVTDAENLEIQFIDGSKANAVIKGFDSDVDLAVIAISLKDLTVSTKESIAVATLGDSDILKVGEPAIAIGNALGYGQSVTTGVISALNRELTVENITNTLIQTDAAINPGNSGGALLNMKGEVVGINSNKIGGSTIEGMGYAIPISSARPIIEELMTKETRVKVDEALKGYLGIYGVDVTDDVSKMYDMPKGVYISQAVEDSAAANGGLNKGDIITKFDGTSVKSMEQLQGLLEYYAAGTKVDVTIQQKNGVEYIEKTCTVILGEKFN